MFKGDKLVKPHRYSVYGTLVVAILVFIGSRLSPLIGYFIALGALVMIVVALYMHSIWPSQSKRENTLVFSLFWGLMLGALAPFIVQTYLEGGTSAVLELFTS